MKRIGITGQAGFMGTHLYNFLSLKRDEVELIPFSDNYFNDPVLLTSFVKKCDVIVHLAAMNRHGDANVIYETNIRLVKILIDVLENNQLKPMVLFSSSTQEDRDNLYGKSKREGRLLLEQWAERNQALFTALVIPNVFGPFGRPYYNSVIGTFSHQIVHKETPRIEIDAKLSLIYIDELVEEIWKIIERNLDKKTYYIAFTKEILVSDILQKLFQFNEKYIAHNIIPELNSKFDVALFNTFRSYIDLKDHYPVKLDRRVDDRGYLIETIKELTGGQSFFSTTKPSITRGNHFHRRKIERFCVLKGEAEIKMRRMGCDEILTFSVCGERPATIDMPIWYTHNITNVGTTELLTLFWCNEIFNDKDSDTYFMQV